MLIFIAIILITFLAGVEIDICVASLPQIRQIFNTSHFETELILGANLLFHCIFGFIIGILGDRYNKNKIISIGTIVFIISSLGCAISNNFYLLIFWRIIQGISISAPMILSGLLIFDYFQKEKQAGYMTKLNGLATLGVATAPAIGSYLTIISWRLNFIFLAIVGIISFIIFNYATKHTKVINNTSSGENLQTSGFSGYIEILTSKSAMIHILTTACSIAAYYSFVGMSSMIYIEGFGVSVREFGFYQGSLALAFGIFSIINDRIVKLINSDRMLKISLLLLFVFLLANVFIIIFNIKNPKIVTPFLILWSTAVVHPLNLIYMKTLNVIKDANSKISAILTLFKWLFSVVGFQTASYFFTGDFRANGIIILIFYSFTLCGWHYLHRKHNIFN